MPRFVAQRGAVNIVFLVVIIIVALAFGALWFMKMQEAEDRTTEAQLARAERDKAVSQAMWARDYYAAIAAKVGGEVPKDVPIADDSGMTSGRDAANKAVQRIDEALKSAGPSVDDTSANPATLIESLEIPKNAYGRLKGEREQLRLEIKRLQDEVTAKDGTIASNQRGYAEEMARIQTETETTQSRLNTQLNDVRTLNEEVQNKIREANAELEKNREEANKEKQQLITEKKEMDGRVRQMHGELTIKRTTESPDGRVLSADPRSGIVMLDITSKDTLRRGTRFKVYETGKGGMKIHKGWVTVTNIGPDMSEARIDERVAGVGLIGSGDWVFNPFFDKEKKAKFVFLGQLPGRFTRETAERILTSFGAKVEEKITTDTDFLVLGDKEDPEGEALEDSPEYKKAVQWGIEIIRARDLAPFLQI